jgi:hypothetical protein
MIVEIKTSHFLSLCAQWYEKSSVASCCQKYEQSKHQWYEKISVTSCCQRFEQPKHNDMKIAQWLHVAENMSNQSIMIWKELSDFALIKKRATEAQWFDKISMTSHCQKYVQPKQNDIKRANDFALPKNKQPKQSTLASSTRLLPTSQRRASPSVTSTAS